MDSLLSDAQKQAADTFGFKWHSRDSYESPAFQRRWKQWLLEKYFDNDASRLEQLLPTGDNAVAKSVLDAGCGSGGSALLLFGESLRYHRYLGIDVSDAITVAEQRFAEQGIPGEFRRCDLHALRDAHGPFDIIFSEGVLHHTDSVEVALSHLSTLLKPGGVFLFYVYAKKAPAREFTDDLVRQAIAPLSNPEAWNALLPLTRLGKAIGELGVEVDVEDDIPFLGIRKGRHDLHRLLYYTVIKMFYHPEFTVDEMNHVNFDWFRPLNCHRHTPEEVRAFCDAAGLRITRMHIEESGISVISVRESGR